MMVNDFWKQKSWFSIQNIQNYDIKQRNNTVNISSGWKNRIRKCEKSSN